MTRIKPLHLGRRFVRTLWPGPPRKRDVAWVAGILEPGELRLWRSLPNHDQRYTIRVAKAVEERLAGTEFAGQPRWLAAALLHDVGKLDAGLGVAGRTVATVAGAVRSRTRASSGRFGRYLRHDELGAAMLRAAGGREEAAAWAAVHHHRERWARTSGFRRRAAWYLHHDERGADRIRAAGGRDEAARWAGAHHQRDRWPASGVPIPVAEALEAADNA